MYWEILDEHGEVINRIIAHESWVEAHYPGRYRAIDMPVFPDEPPPPDTVRQLLEALGQAVLPKLIVVGELSGDQIDAVMELFATWQPGEVVGAGQWRRYEGKLYECAQGHTTQADWTPDVTPALWVARTAPGTVGEWVQPAGAHDAYNTGDRVLFNGNVYESTIDANTWSPTAYPQGWAVI